MLDRWRRTKDTFTGGPLHHLDSFSQSFPVTVVFFYKGGYDHSRISELRNVWHGARKNLLMKLIACGR